MAFLSNEALEKLNIVKEHKDKQVTFASWSNRQVVESNDIIDVESDGILSKKNIQKINRLVYLNKEYKITDEAQEQYDIYKFCNLAIKELMKKESNKDYKKYFVDAIIEKNKDFYLLSIKRNVSTAALKRWEFYGDVAFKIDKNGQVGVVKVKTPQKEQ